VVQARDEFIIAAVVPRAAHASGTLDAAEAILAAHPEVARGDLYAASVLGDSDELASLLAETPGQARAGGGPLGWDALTYLCFSQYLRLRPSDGFVSAADLLLDAGADPNSGYFDAEHQPEPTFESVLYGAAGVAHHAALTRLLLARGADPNLGGEVAYHGAEGFENGAMEAVVESGRLSESGLTTMLHRKLDWTDLRGLSWLLAHGADPNTVTAWGDRALHHSLGRDNALRFLEVLMDAGADPSLGAPRFEGRSAVAVAAWAGRADALDLFARRGFATDLAGDDAFFAALARADRGVVLALVEAEPAIVARIEAKNPGTLARLAGAGNTSAVALALDLGFPLSDQALPLAVWRERTETVRLLLARGAAVSGPVLSLAERAQSEHSDWTPHDSPEILELLTAAAGKNSI
jgi:ankyrin repeat protein